VWHRGTGIRIADGKSRLLTDRYAAAAQAILSVRDREQRLHFRTTIKAARLQADGLCSRDRNGGTGVKGGETRKARRVERSSTGRGGETPEHVVAADQMSNSVVPNQSSCGGAVELRHTYEMCTSRDRGHCCGVTEGSAEWHGAKQHRIFCIESNAASYVSGMPSDCLLVVQDQFSSGSFHHRLH
jgi:hypothetical protein